jgi:hypothetical protein
VRAERRLCPSEYQDMIDAKLGTNRYGEPLFRLAWGQTETMRAGGSWPGFRGYKDILVVRSVPCWMILMWEPGEVFGSPELWYIQNKDEQGFQTLGEYPYHGRYRVLHQLVNRERIGERLLTEHLELTTLIVESIIPLCKVWQDLSKEVQVQCLIYDEEDRDREAAQKAFEAKKDCGPAFGGRPVSFTGQGCRTSLIAKKVHVLETQFNRLMNAAAKYERGFQQR